MKDGAAPFQTAKASLRKAAALRRAALAPAGIDAAARAMRHFFGVLSPAPGTVVSGYWPLRDELDPRPLLEALHRRGCVCSLPAVVTAGEPLAFRRWAPGSPLVPGPFGTSEPAPDAPPLSPALLLVPLLAFDRRGHRLGYGGGFYDRTLADLRARGKITAIGLGFAGQEVEAVPDDAGDQRLDWLVTENYARPVRVVAPQP